MNCFIIAALTADGFIAKHSQHLSTRWTSREDGQFFQKMTKQAGVVVVGRKTFATFKKPLPDRLNVVYTSESKQSADGVVYTNQPPLKLLNDLAGQGYQTVAICGGSSIYTLFLEAGVVNKLYLTIEPVIFGQGLNLFTKNLSLPTLKLIDVHRLSDQTLVLEYNL